MRTRIFFFAAATSLVLLILLAGGALGQGTYQAQIRGVVSDPTGAVVGNATVTITETAPISLRPQKPAPMVTTFCADFGPPPTV